MFSQRIEALVLDAFFLPSTHRLQQGRKERSRCLVQVAPDDLETFRFLVPERITQDRKKEYLVVETEREPALGKQPFRVEEKKVRQEIVSFIFYEGAAAQKEERKEAKVETTSTTSNGIEAKQASLITTSRSDETKKTSTQEEKLPPPSRAVAQEQTQRNVEKKSWQGESNGSETSTSRRWENSRAEQNSLSNGNNRWTGNEERAQRATPERLRPLAQTDAKERSREAPSSTGWNKNGTTLDPHRRSQTERTRSDGQERRDTQQRTTTRGESDERRRNTEQRRQTQQNGSLVKERDQRSTPEREHNGAERQTLNTKKEESQPTTTRVDNGTEGHTSNATATEENNGAESQTTTVKEDNSAKSQPATVKRCQEDDEKKEVAVQPPLDQSATAPAVQTPQDEVPSAQQKQETLSSCSSNGQPQPPSPSHQESSISSPITASSYHNQKTSSSVYWEGAKVALVGSGFRLLLPINEAKELLLAFERCQSSAKSPDDHGLFLFVNCDLWEIIELVIRRGEGEVMLLLSRETLVKLMGQLRTLLVPLGGRPPVSLLDGQEAMKAPKEEKEQSPSPKVEEQEQRQSQDKGCNDEDKRARSNEITQTMIGSQTTKQEALPIVKCEVRDREEARSEAFVPMDTNGRQQRSNLNYSWQEPRTDTNWQEKRGESGDRHKQTARESWEISTKEMNRDERRNSKTERSSPPARQEALQYQRASNRRETRNRQPEASEQRPSRDRMPTRHVEELQSFDVTTSKQEPITHLGYGQASKEERTKEPSLAKWKYHDDEDYFISYTPLDDEVEL